MINPRLAARYAKSWLDLAIEQNKVEEVWADVQLLRSVFKSSPEVVTVLKSPVITADKKIGILNAITQGRVSEITSAFLKLLVSKTRENKLTEILSGFETAYNDLKGIHKVKFTTATPVGEALQEALKNKIRESKGLQNLEWESVVDESIIGGYKLQLGDLLVDASISHDLKDIKRQFLNNDYIHKIR